MFLTLSFVWIWKFSELFYKCKVLCFEVWGNLFFTWLNYKKINPLIFKIKQAVKKLITDKRPGIVEQSYVLWPGELAGVEEHRGGPWAHPVQSSQGLLLEHSPQAKIISIPQSCRVHPGSHPFRFTPTTIVNLMKTSYMNNSKWIWMPFLLDFLPCAYSHLQTLPPTLWKYLTLDLV